MIKGWYAWKRNAKNKISPCLDQAVLSPIETVYSCPAMIDKSDVLDALQNDMHRIQIWLIDDSKLFVTTHDNHVHIAIHIDRARVNLQMLSSLVKMVTLSMKTMAAIPGPRWNQKINALRDIINQPKQQRRGTHRHLNHRYSSNVFTMTFFCIWTHRNQVKSPQQKPDTAVTCRNPEGLEIVLKT